MKNKILAMMIVLFLAIGFAPLQAAEGGGKAIPVITQSFASKEASPGDTWKIYLNVVDPNGEMTNIYAVVDQAGSGQYPVSIIKVMKENQKELSGYIYLSTFHSDSPLNDVNITLTVQVQDRSGDFSQPAVFPLKLNIRSVQEPPPQGIFKERALGPVMFKLRKTQDMSRVTIPDPHGFGLFCSQIQS